jgi:hypothetical protein
MRDNVSLYKDNFGSAIAVGAFVSHTPFDV